MRCLIEQVPIEAEIMIPFVPLAEFVAHEDQLLAWLQEHISEEQTQVSEFAPVIPGHFGEQRTFAIDDLVMRERQDEVLVKGVGCAEGQLIVMILAKNRIFFEIAERVVCKSHVPFESESQTAHIRW